MEYLDPLVLKPKYFDHVEKEIIRIFDAIYAPLYAIMKRNGFQIKNASDPLVDALESGRIYYENGLFKGDFNSKITKRFQQLGATYSRLRRGWRFDGVMPPFIQIVLAQVESRTRGTIAELVQTLDDIDVERLTGTGRFAGSYERTVDEMDADFQRTVKKISIAPKLTPAMRKQISQQWGNNLDLYIQDWSKKNILKLRSQIKQNTFAGRRAENLENFISHSYKTSRAKAKFLARQETSLLMSKFREQRYKQIGVTRYKWSTSHDERVRLEHKHLNGKIFSFDQPPVSGSDGERLNPGEPFGCRCVAIAIVDGA